MKSNICNIYNASYHLCLILQRERAKIKFKNTFYNTCSTGKEPYAWHYMGIRWRHWNVGQYNEGIDHTIDYYFGTKHLGGGLH